MRHDPARVSEPGRARAVTGRGPAIGVIGAGRMGQPLCARLVACGFDVTVTDVRVQARAGVVDAGARWVGSVTELARRSAVLLTVLPGPEAVAAVRGDLLASLPRGSTWIDMSTSTPAVCRENAHRAAECGVRTLDAPMGGGPAEAGRGELVLFIGGEPDDVHAQREVLDTLAARVIHVAATAGSGCLVKLLVNLLWFGQALAGAEVLSLATRAGLDPEVVRGAVQQSAAAVRFMGRDAQALMAGDDLTSFSIAGCLDELRSVGALATELEVPLPLAERVTDLYAQALARYGDVDGELLAARLITERANVSFGRESRGAEPGS